MEDPIEPDNDKINEASKMNNNEEIIKTGERLATRVQVTIEDEKDTKQVHKKSVEGVKYHC